MDVSLFNKYDSIKRKNRTPSYKALLSIQLSTNFDSNSDLGTVKVAPINRKKNSNLHPAKLKKEPEINNQHRSIPRVRNIASSCNSLTTSDSAKMNFQSKAQDQYDEPQKMDEDSQSPKKDSSFLSECSELAVSFDGFPEEDQSVSTSNQQLCVLKKLKSTNTVETKSFCGFSSGSESAYGFTDTAESCEESDLEDACSGSLELHGSLKRPHMAASSDPTSHSRDTVITLKSALTSTPSRSRESNSLMDLSQPLFQLPSKVNSLSPFSKPHNSSVKTNILHSEAKHQNNEVSSLPKVLKKRPNNSTQAKEMHLNLQNALSDALNFFQETMPDDCETKENKPVVLEKQFTSEAEDKLVEKETEMLSNLRGNTNQIIEKDDENHTTVPEVYETLPPVSDAVPSLQDALSDAVDFFKATSFDSDNIYGEIIQDQTRIPCNEDLQAEVEPKLKRNVHQEDNRSEISDHKSFTSSACDSMPCKSSTAPMIKIENDDDSIDEAMFAAAKAALTGCESMCSVLGYGKKSVSQDSALHLAMSDVITHWLTTGQANYSQPKDESELKPPPKSLNGLFLDMDDTEAWFEHQGIPMSNNLVDHRAREADDIPRYDVSPIALDGLEHILDHGSENPHIDPIESVNSFILNSSKFMDENDVDCDKTVTHDRVKTSQDDTLGAELHNSPTGMYNCVLKLSMDPTTAVPEGAVGSLFRKTFCQSPLSREICCFSSCYKRYTALLSKADKHEQKRLQEMNLNAASKATASGDSSSPSKSVSQKRKYTKRKHLQAFQEQQAIKAPGPSAKIFMDKEAADSSTLADDRPKKFTKRSSENSFDVEEAKLKRKNLRLRLSIPLENYGCLSDHFVMHAKELEMPYLSGWRREVVYRLASGQLCDVYYYSPRKEKFRSSAGIAHHLRAAGPDHHLKLTHFDFSRVQHNVGAPFEYIRPASLFRRRAGQGALSGHQRKKLRYQAMDFVSDFDFLGFMEDDSSLDFEGFTRNDRVEYKQQKLISKESDSNVSIGSRGSGALEEGGGRDPDEALEKSSGRSEAGAVGALSNSCEGRDEGEKQLDGNEKVCVNVSTKLNPAHALFEESTEMVDELHMELYASDVDIKDESVDFDGEDSKNVSHSNEMVKEETVDDEMNVENGAEAGPVPEVDHLQPLDSTVREDDHSHERKIVKPSKGSSKLDDVQGKLNVGKYMYESAQRSRKDSALGEDESNDEYMSDDDEHGEASPNESLEASELLVGDLDESLELVRTEVASSGTGVASSALASTPCHGTAPSNSSNERFTTQIRGQKLLQTENEALKSNSAAGTLASASPCQPHLPVRSSSSGKQPAPSMSPTLEDDTVSSHSLSCTNSYDRQFFTSQDFGPKSTESSQKLLLHSDSDTNYTEVNKFCKSDEATSSFLDSSNSSLATQASLSSSQSYGDQLSPMVSGVKSSSFKSRPQLHQSKSDLADESIPQFPQAELTFLPKKASCRSEITKCEESLPSIRKDFLKPVSCSTANENGKDSAQGKEMGSQSTSAPKFIFKVADTKLVAAASSLSQAHGAQPVRSAATTPCVPGKSAVVTKSSGIITFNRNLFFPAMNSGNKSQIGGDLSKTGAEKSRDSAQQQLLLMNPSSYPQTFTKDGGSPVPPASNKIITFKISDLIDKPNTL